MFGWLFSKKRVWRNKDYDIPVTFICKVGKVNGVVYAQVEFEGKTSFVPYKELYYVT
jgi:hypothetical protein